MDHESENGVQGLLTTIGGKWTTARHLAEQVVDMTLVKLGLEHRPSVTAETPVYGGDTGGFTEFKDRAKDRFQGVPPDVVAHLADNYGAAMDEVLRLAEEDPALYARLDDARPEIAAEVVHAVRHEMALSLDDALFRRIGIGALGRPSEETIARRRPP